MRAIDSKDKQILSILDWDGRVLMNRIAKQTRLNKDVVRYRIKKLEEQGVIEGYYPIINTAALGYLTVRIYFDLISANKEVKDRIIEYLDKEFNAGIIFLIDGRYDVGVISWEKSMFELDKKLKLFNNNFGEFISKEDVSIFTVMCHYPKKFLHKRELGMISIQEQEGVLLKEKDEYQNK